MWLCKALDAYDFMIVDVFNKALHTWLRTVDIRLTHTLTRLELSRGRRGVNTVTAFFDIIHGDKVITEAISDAKIACSDLDMLGTTSRQVTLSISCVGILRPHQGLGEITSELTFTLDRVHGTLVVKEIQTGGQKTSYDAVRLFLKNKEGELDRYA